MLKCSTSLWSADLANLAAEIKRVDAYSERFHLDVADGHYVPSLLFFPDLVNLSPVTYAQAVRGRLDDSHAVRPDHTRAFVEAVPEVGSSFVSTR